RALDTLSRRATSTAAGKVPMIRNELRRRIRPALHVFQTAPINRDDVLGDNCNDLFDSPSAAHGSGGSYFISAVSLTRYSWTSQVASTVYRWAAFRPARAGLWVRAHSPLLLFCPAKYCKNAVLVETI